MTLSHKAFNLIEILIVLGILSLLLVISLSLFLNFREKSNLRTSAQILETTLQQAFSSARSTPQVFGVEMLKGASFISPFQCEETTCITKNYQSPVKFNGKITISSPDRFEIQFFPPHGDLKFLDESGTENMAETMSIKLSSENGYSKTLMVYRKSGLITGEK